MWLNLGLLAAISTILTIATCYPSQNTPPIFESSRDWMISENEPIGSRIITVRTRDDDGDTMKYGIEPSVYKDGSHFFTIDAKSGEVFLKESLLGKANEQYYLLVTANDGHQTAKIENFVRILPATGSSITSVQVHGNTSSLPTGPRRQLFPPAPPQLGPTHPFAFNSFPWPGRPASFPAPNPRPATPIKSKSTTSTAPKDPAATPGLPTARPIRPIRPAIDTNFENNGIDLGKDTSSDRSETTNGHGGHGSGYRYDFIMISLALTAAVLLGCVGFIAVSSLRNQKRLVKSISRKIPLEIETSLSSVSSQNSDSRPEFMKSNAHFKWPLVNRYESSCDNFLSSPFNNSPDGWEFPRKNLRFSKHLLGEGNFGQVWKCEALDFSGSSCTSEIVAVKMLKQSHTEREKRDLLLELQIMKLLEPHPNIVTLLGCCSDRDPVYLIMEYVPHGKLLTYLRESRLDSFKREFGSLTSQDLISFAAQVARGMEYISSKGILHRDLAARNVLVGQNKICKISDFGFARDVIDNHVYEKKGEGRLPIRWMAPESIIENIYTTKSDVWSFGVLLWEIVTLGMTPFPGIEVKEIPKMLKEGKRLERPEHCSQGLYMLMSYCWEASPKNRINFNELKNKLDEMLNSNDDYIELERCPDHNYYNMKHTSPDEKL